MKRLTFIALLPLFMVLGCAKENIKPTKDGIAGSITRFAIVENYLYALDQNQIKVYDITDASNPVYISKVDTDYGLQTIVSYEGSLYVGSRDALYIVNIDNPSSPFVEGKSVRDIRFGRCDPVVVKGDKAYSTVKNIANVCGETSAVSALLVYDVSDKSNPKSIQEIRLDRPNGLGYAGQTLFVCDEGLDKVLLFDILSDGKVSQQNNTIDIENPIDIIIKNNLMIVSHEKGFVFYDISNIADIKMLDKIVKA